MVITHVIKINILSDLKTLAGSNNSVVLLSGKTAIGDSNARTYYWDGSSTDAEDLVYMNVIAVTGKQVGRWKALSVKIQVLPHGLLIFNGPKKEFFSTSSYVTDANGECSINLTTNNTPTGTAIFTEIWGNYSRYIPPATSSLVANDAIIGVCKTQSADLKTTKHLFMRGNSTTLGGTLLAIVGLVIPGLRAAPINTAVQFKVEGI